MKLQSPKGHDIIGTHDVLIALTYIDNSGIEKAKDGKYEFQYEGESKIDWDSQEPKELDGERMFVCAKGRAWKESELKLVPENAEEKRKLKTKPVKRACDAQTCICSGELMAEYGVNKSEKEGKTFWICGPCAVYLRRGGSKLKQV